MPFLASRTVRSGTFLTRTTRPFITAVGTVVLSAVTASTLSALPPPRSCNTRTFTVDRMLLHAVASLPMQWRSPKAISHELIRASFIPLVGESVPVLMTVTPANPIGGVDSLSVTIQVTQTGDYVQVGTDKPQVVNSPSLAWPYDVYYPIGGSTTRTITLTTNYVPADTVVRIYACPSGVDPSVSSNWSVVQSVTVHPLGWSGGSPVGK